jgi:ABC-type phosphate transport system substrate-binding protein
VEGRFKTHMAAYGLRLSILAVVFCSSTYAQCVPGGLAVVVNKGNPVESLSMAQLRKLILGDVRAWQNNKQVALVARDPSSKDFQCLLSSVVRLSVGDYRRYVMSAEFRGDEPMTIQIVDSDSTAARYVGGSAGGLAVVEANSLPAIGGTVKVVRIDGKTLGQPGYPL